MWLLCVACSCCCALSMSVPVRQVLVSATVMNRRFSSPMNPVQLSSHWISIHRVCSPRANIRCQVHREECRSKKQRGTKHVRRIRVALVYEMMQRACAHSYASLSSVEYVIRWRSAQPEDVFVHIMAFLSPPDLAHVSIVNHAWKHVSYDAGLWRVLDLSNMYTKGEPAWKMHVMGMSHRS